jgi:Pyridine nucleotide-disulphide oxidoreductase
MELDAVSERLLVLGGGYIGIEFGQMFRRFGSRVTLMLGSSRRRTVTLLTGSLESSRKMALNFWSSLGR